MLLVDLEEGRLIPDEEIKATLARSHPYEEWLEQYPDRAGGIAGRPNQAPISNLSLLDRQQAFGYTQEDLKILMTPMATTGEEAVGSMGNDTPISALSDKPKLLFTYFKQNFAQVTNPPIDPIREEMVMSLVSIIGPRPNCSIWKGCRRPSGWRCASRSSPTPISRRSARSRRSSDAHFKSQDLRHHLCPAEHGADGHGWAHRRAVRAGRGSRARRHQHHHPVRPQRRRRPHSDPVAARLRGRASSPDPRGPAHLGRARGGVRRAARGASFLLPRRLRRGGDQSLSRLRDADRHEGRSAAAARRQGNRQALHQVDRQGAAQGDVQDGHLDLSVLLRRADFRRGRICDRISSTATSPAPRPASRASGLAEIAEETVRRHREAFGDSPIYRDALDVGGDYAVRVRGEDHVWTAATVAALQHAVRGNSQRPVSRLCQDHQRADRAAADHPRPVPHQDRRGRRPQAGADRGGRAGEQDRAALRHRRHVVRLDFARGAYHARHRHEPHRRQIEHRRRRRGSRPLQAAAERRFHALGDQAGGLRPFRRHRRISGQLGHDADQDGAGRQARRRRPAAGPQGRSRPSPRCAIRRPASA